MSSKVFVCTSEASVAELQEAGLPAEPAKAARDVPNDDSHMVTSGEEAASLKIVN